MISPSGEVIVLLAAESAAAFLFCQDKGPAIREC
nr:MAG TPA: hypothetical protein [Bacteriophage sp.]